MDVSVFVEEDVVPFLPVVYATGELDGLEHGFEVGVVMLSGDKVVEGLTGCQTDAATVETFQGLHHIAHGCPVKVEESFPPGRGFVLHPLLVEHVGRGVAHHLFVRLQAHQWLPEGRSALCPLPLPPR